VLRGRRFLVTSVPLSFGSGVVSPRQGQSALINDPALLAGRSRNRFDRILERCGCKRTLKHSVEVDRLDTFALCRRTDHDHELPSRLSAVPIGKRQRRHLAAANLFMQLGQLPAHRRRSPAEPGGQIIEHGGNTRAGFEKDQRRGQVGELIDAGAPRGGARRQEALEEKSVRREARRRERCQYRRSARHCRDNVTCRLGSLHQLEPRIGNQWCAGV